MNDDVDVDCTVWAETVKNFVAEKAALGFRISEPKEPEPISSPPPPPRKQGEVWKFGREWKIRIAEIAQVDDPDLFRKIMMDGSIRDLVCADNKMIEKIDQVQRSNPHFSNVISFFRRHLLASKNTKRPIRIPHILLMGEPGVGKTHVLRSLASAIGLPFSVLDAPALNGAGVFSGTDRSWKNPHPGKIAEALIRSPIANQIVLLDEIDKVYQHPSESDTLAPLHSLLEPSTAARWKDECLGIELDARYLCVVATANCIRNIAPSLLDRFVIFRIEQPDAEISETITRSIFDSLKDQFGDWFKNADLNPDVIGTCRNESPRSIRKRLISAMVSAAADNRKKIIPADLFFDPENHESRKSRIGFIHSR